MTTILVRGEASFMFVNNVDRYGKYSIEVTNLDADSIQRMKDAGMGHRLTEDSMANVEKLKAEGKKATFKGTFVRARSNKKIPCTMKDGTAVTEIIGNGSKIQAILKKFSYDGFGGGTSVGAEKVQIDELVKYVSEADQAGEADEAQASGAAEFI